MGSINDHGVEVEHRGIQSQPKGSNHHGPLNGREEIDGRGRDVVENLMNYNKT
jgi:hypothetical protein